MCVIIKIVNANCQLRSLISQTLMCHCPSVPAQTCCSKALHPALLLPQTTVVIGWSAEVRSEKQKFEHQQRKTSCPKQAL